MTGTDFESMVALGVLWYVVFLMAITFHESAHALAAMWGGDPTAFHAGQVTLSPLPHLQREPFGTILIPILSFVISGWMIGWASAPYDPDWQRRHPRRAAWMALAGPAANAVLVLIATVLLRAGLASGFFAPPLDRFRFTQMVVSPDPGIGSALATFLSILLMLNILLGIFNLMPVPPLDGNTAVTLLMSKETARHFTKFTHNPTFSMMGIVLAWMVFGRISGVIWTIAIALLYS